MATKMLTLKIYNDNGELVELGSFETFLIETEEYGKFWVRYGYLGLRIISGNGISLIGGDREIHIKSLEKL